MTLNATGSRGESSCNDSLVSFNRSMEAMYTYFYLLLFIPGLLLNTVALWVLCRHISKKTKAVIFMINLALADLAHILSLPLRIYYYFTHTWPFGQSICLVCFYLKYLNMYAAIVFLVCISVQRCIFLLKPFAARGWRRRYDLLISITVWLVVGLACAPFIVMRSSERSRTVSNTTRPPDVNPNPQSAESKDSCFKDLPIRKVSLTMLVSMMTLNELLGFLIPLACIGISSIRIVWSLKKKQTSSACSRLQSVTSNGQPEKAHENPASSEKQRALRMVLSCSALFLVCFAPYHINFLLYVMVSQNYLSHCATRLAVKQFHPVSLCIASLSCCLNPLLYYFLTAEFRMHLSMRTASFSSSLLSSPTECPKRRKMLRLESTCSERE